MSTGAFQYRSGRASRIPAGITTIKAATTPVRAAPGISFHRHAFCEVARLVHVRALEARKLITQELHYRRHQERKKRGVNLAEVLGKRNPEIAELLKFRIGGITDPHDARATS